MKTLRKVFAFALVLMLAMALTAPTFADPATGTITVSGTTSGKVYDLYRIFDLTYQSSGSSMTVSYTINSEWENFFIGSSAPGASYLSAYTGSNPNNLNMLSYGGNEYLINITSSNVQAFTFAAQAYALSLGANHWALTGTASGTSLAFNNAPLGYYLVYPRGASSNTSGALCSLDSSTPNATISVKGVYPGIEKTVNDASVEVGQTVTFTVAGTVPNTTGYKAYQYKVTDTMSDGLTFNSSTANFTVKINNSTLPTTAYTLTYTTTPANGFTLVIPMVDTTTHEAKYTAGQAISISYSAVVNDAAVVNLTNNSAVLEYSNNPYADDGGDLEENPPVVVDLYSSQIKVLKTDNGTPAARLQYAKFVLVKNPGASEVFYKYDATTHTVSWVSAIAQATEVETGADGICYFNGLEDGTYYLRETAAPEGYNLLTADEECEVEHTTDTATGKPIGVSLEKTIVNKAGTILPSTGGVGTTLFYIFGGLMVVGAAVVLVARKRVNE